MCARQVNCGTSADGIRDPAGSVSVRLRVHALARVLLTQAVFMGNLEWIKLYRAVLKESDPQKRLAKIEDAEQVMKQALRE